MMHDNPQRTREIFLFGGFYKWKRISSVDVNFKIQFKCDEAPVKPFYLYKYTNFICREADHLSCSTTKNSCCLPLKFCFIQSVAVVLQSFPDFRFVFFSWAPIFCQVLVLENSFTALKFCPNLYFLLRPFRKVSCLPLQTAVLFTGLLAQSPQILFYPTANSAVCVKRSFTNQGRKVHKLERMVMWVFGYASLVWKPGFEYDEKLVGFIKGHRRVFNLACIEHRGTPAFPARTCTLEAQEGAICWGTAYSVSGGPEEEKAAIEYLARRECEYDVQDYVDFYQETNPETPLLTGVLVFTSTPDKIANKYFLGSAPFEEMASQIAKAVGPCGNNREYLFKLEKALYDIGHEDAEVIELANEVRRITSSEIDLGAIDDHGITSFEMDNHEIDLEAIDDHESTSSEIDNHETDLEDIDDPEVTSSETDNREIDLGTFNDHEIKSSEIDNVIPMEQTSFCLPNSYKQFLIAAPESF